MPGAVVGNQAENMEFCRKYEIKEMVNRKSFAGY
jgi:hypothetical protein